MRALTEELDARTGYRRVVGESQQWRQVLTQATQVACDRDDGAAARRVGDRQGSRRALPAPRRRRASSGPFIALNCAALPEQLLEAELFGYERGAYTGATQSKPGQLEQAAGGTLFLDEVGEMSPSAQAKFLRVLQEREFQRLGGTRVLRTDARVVAATNRDLQRAIAQRPVPRGPVLPAERVRDPLPPLRDRRDDILPLSEAFLAEIGRGLGRPPAGISREARQLLRRLPLAGQRPRAAEHPRARGDPVRGRADHRRSISRSRVAAPPVSAAVSRSRSSAAMPAAPDPAMPAHRRPPATCSRWSAR